MAVTALPKILFDSGELLAIDKPAGLIVHSDGRTKEPSLAEWLLERYPFLKDVGEPWISPQGQSFPVAGIVHRLDRTTSGVVVAAKTNETFAKLKQLFKERRVEKTYLAYVYGHMEQEAGRIVAEIARSASPPKKWYAIPTSEDEKRAAITHWKLIKRGSDGGEPYSYIEVHPQTGRTHQIRVHLSSTGHPIVADHLYAAAKQRLLGFKRPALHASSISFPWGGSHSAFAAPLPPDFPQA